MSYTSTEIKQVEYLVSLVVGGDTRDYLILRREDDSFVRIPVILDENFNDAIQAAVDSLVGTAPGLLDTLGELSDALGDDANFAATTATALAARLKYRGAWAAATAYVTNDVVFYNSGFYRAPSNFTSGGTFTPASWTELVPQYGGSTIKDKVLKEWTTGESYELTAITRDTDNVVTTATVIWPDGSAGVFTTDTKNASPPAINAYHITHTDSGKTVTQTLMTRNASGAVTVKPALTVA